MRRFRARLLLGSYWRRVRCAWTFGNGVVVPAMVPCSAVWQPRELLAVGGSTTTAFALGAAYNVEDGPSFTNVATHQHFSVFARAWLGEPLEQPLNSTGAVFHYDAEVEGLLCAPSAGDMSEPAQASLGGHLLDFTRWCGWQPGLLLEEAVDTFGFWAARGRVLGQSRVSRVLSGYYLSLLQARFRCRVGLHVRCLPSLQRGDVAFVRMALLRWRWAPF